MENLEKLAELVNRQADLNLMQMKVNNELQSQIDKLFAMIKILNKSVDDIKTILESKYYDR